MAAALRIPRIRLWITDTPPSLDQIRSFESFLARRLAREPLQYVLGTADFAGLTLTVGPGCFIPRSETEVLVERVEERLRASSGSPAILVDVGTGSGAILLALLTRFPTSRGIGVDRSERALRWARGNADTCRCAQRTSFVRGSLMEWCGGGGVVDAVVSNPPYIREDDAHRLAPEIAEYEPREALFSGVDGLDHVRDLLPGAASALRPGGVLGLEIGMEQGEAVRHLLEGMDWEDAAVLPDLAGRPRVVLATRSRRSDPR
jgi:release factor glutamine methyltransferase